MVLGYSRAIAALFTLDQTLEARRRHGVVCGRGFFLRRATARSSERA